MNERERQKDAAPLGDLVDRLMKAYQLDGKLLEMDVLNRWEELMGKAVAVRTRGLYIKNRVLYIELDSSVMRDELLFGKQVIIERVNEYAKKSIIDDVYFA